MPPKSRLRPYLSLLFWIGLVGDILGSEALPLQAQLAPVAQLPTVNRTPTDDVSPRTPSLQPLPEIKPDPPPPIDQLRIPPPTQPTKLTPGNGQTVPVKTFQLDKNDVFSQSEIDKATKAFRDRDLSIPELFQAAAVITQLYVSKGYITTGAYIRAGDEIKDGIVPVRVVEGTVKAADIRVRFKTKRHRLKPNYISSRLALATQAPLNKQRLLEALQLLKLNPLIQDIQAELSEGSSPGQSFLDVEVTEAKTFGVQALLDNGRSPSVGTFRRQLQVSEANVLGLGDGLALTYTNTPGSNEGALSYTLPVNPHNGTVSFNFGIAGSRIIEAPFDVLDIRSQSRYFELTFRQPIVQTPTREFALGITASRQYSKATLVDGEIPFPVSGSDFEGITRVNALRFFQDWTQRSDRSVFAARSQFSVGLNFFDTTINEKPPDGRFFAWRGQVQWTRLLAPETLLLLRGDLQVAGRSLVPLEQFGLGGVQNVRGYRQDAVLSDSGLFLSAEVAIPILRLPKIAGLLQVAPFFDFGTAWNASSALFTDLSTLASVGLGLRLQVNNRLNARFDWGIPLIDSNRERKTLQEKGLYFSLTYSFFNGLF